MSKFSDLHRKWSRDPDYRRAYDDLELEFALARSLIEAAPPGRETAHMPQTVTGAAAPPAGGSRRKIFCSQVRSSEGSKTTR